MSKPRIATINNSEENRPKSINSTDGCAILCIQMKYILWDDIIVLTSWQFGFHAYSQCVFLDFPQKSPICCLPCQLLHRKDDYFPSKNACPLAKFKSCNFSISLTQNSNRQSELQR